MELCGRLINDLLSSNSSVLLRELFAGWVLLPLMDVVADPGIINQLIILVCSHKLKENLNVSNTCETVEFLNGFVEVDDKVSSLASDLKSVLKKTDTLYCFMQFLKKEGHVHILQFCLDIGE